MTVTTAFPLALTPRRAWLVGLRDTAPLLLGAAPFGLLYGALAVDAGLPVWAALGMSLVVFAGASQVIAVAMVAAGAAWPVIVLVTLVVNLRHALYGLTLAPHLRHLPQRWQAALAFWLTDETFVVVARHYAAPGPAAHRPHIQLASSLAMYVNWFAWTLVGVGLGRALPDVASWGLGFALTITFIGMLAPALLTRADVMAALVAGAVAVAGHGLPHKLGLLLAALCGVAAGLLAERLSPRQPITTDLAPSSEAA